MRIGLKCWRGALPFLYTYCILHDLQKCRIEFLSWMGTDRPRPFIVTLRSCFRNCYLFTADVKYHWRRWSVKGMFLLYKAKIWVFHFRLYLRKWCRERLNMRSTSTPFVQFCVRAVCVTVVVIIHFFPRNSSVAVLVESIDKLEKHKKFL